MISYCMSVVSALEQWPLHEPISIFSSGLINLGLIRFLSKLVCENILSFRCKPGRTDKCVRMKRSKPVRLPIFDKNWCQIVIKFKIIFQCLNISYDMIDSTVPGQCGRSETLKMDDSESGRSQNFKLNGLRGQNWTAESSVKKSLP